MAHGADMPDSHALRVITEWNELRADQEPWRAELWQRISDYVMPRKSEINTTKTKSVDGYTDRIYDTTAIHANTTLAAGTMDFLVGGRWFANRAPNRNASPAAQEWYKQTGEIMLEVLAQSNFEMEVHSFFMMRSGFGTAHLCVEEDDDDVIYCKSEDIGTYVISENEKGMVDKIMIEKKYTPRQIVQMYGETGLKGNEPIDKDILDRAKGKNQDKRDDKIEVLVIIEPRPARERDPKKQDDPKHWPIRTLHVDKKNKKVLREWGYEEQPFTVSRWAEWGDEVYGYCPSVEVLSTIRQTNFLEENQDLLAELMTNPRFLYPSNLEGDVDLRSGGATIYDEGMPNAKPEEWLTGGRYDIGQDRVTFKRSQIDQAFFVDLFQLLTSLTERGREKTAFEVSEMLSEKVGRFHPTFTRLNTEFSKPFLNRLFSICFRKGLFPEPPEELITERGTIETPKVEFTSKIAMLLKARQNGDFMQFLNLVAQMAQIDPEGVAQEWRRSVNASDSMALLADNQGVHTGFFNTEEQKQAIDEQMAAEAQKQEAMQAAEAGSQAMANMGKAPQQVQDSIGDAIG
jgi:hypothetical protein